eukprot:1604621-Amphidinium_carterae.1
MTVKTSLLTVTIVLRTVNARACWRWCWKFRGLQVHSRPLASAHEVQFATFCDATGKPQARGDRATAAGPQSM